MFSKRKNNSTKVKLNLSPYVWITPAILMFCIFMFYPIVFNFILSFFEWNGFTQQPFEKFIFFTNFIKLFKDPIFWTAFKNTLIFVFFAIAIQNIIALFISIFLFLGEFKGSGVLRAIIFYPCILSSVIVSIIFRNLVLLREGLIYQFTQFFHLPDFFPLSNPSIAFYVIIIAAIWQGIGFNLVIFYAGLQSLDKEMLEAAQIDGANFWQNIFKIIIPLQTPIILICIMLNLISGILIFDLVFVMTRGGPVHSTEVLASYMVLTSFSREQHRLGYGAAIATIMMILMIIFAIIRTRVYKTIRGR